MVDGRAYALLRIHTVPLRGMVTVAFRPWGPFSNVREPCISRRKKSEMYSPSPVPSMPAALLPRLNFSFRRGRSSELTPPVLNGNREAAVGEVCAYVYLCAGVFIGVGKEVVKNLLQAEPIPVQQAVRDGGNGSAAQIVGIFQKDPQLTAFQIRTDHGEAVQFFQRRRKQIRHQRVDLVGLGDDLLIAAHCLSAKSFSLRSLSVHRLSL